MGNGAWAFSGFFGRGRRALPNGTVAGVSVGARTLRAGAPAPPLTIRDETQERYPIQPATKTASPIKMGNIHCHRTRESHKVMKSSGPLRRPVKGGGAE